ncbi:hypothetical protein C5167_001587 [Papaver somniferum]|uniref:Uncharacterized protein n=1 Tax=Papaver somniferum TaxID=3469 RepID=A0A4Y7KWN4_PAPSO|nr:hypothetical protein C5167_001587 [Papaver somniferum]
MEDEEEGEESDRGSQMRHVPFFNRSLCYGCYWISKCYVSEGLEDGGVGVAGGGGLAEAACGGRCLYTKACFKRGYAEDGVYKPKAHMDTENEGEVEDD